VRLFEQVLAKSILAGGYFCLTTSVLIDLRFKWVFFTLLLCLVVLCLRATYEIVSVLTQSQVYLRHFLRMFDSQCVFTLAIYRAQQSARGLILLVLGFGGVHPGEAEILDCTHVNLSVLSLDLLLLVRFDVIRWTGSSEVAPHLLKLSFIWQA